MKEALNLLDKMVKGSQFKGSTNREFCDQLPYFINRFRSPIKFEPDTNSLFEMGHTYFGAENFNSFIELANKQYKGKFYIQTSDKGRIFKTELLPEMIKYIISKTIESHSGYIKNYLNS